MRSSCLPGGFVGLDPTNQLFAHYKSAKIIEESLVAKYMGKQVKYSKTNGT